jgi:hypothetical protein
MNGRYDWIRESGDDGLQAIIPRFLREGDRPDPRLCFEKGGGIYPFLSWDIYEKRRRKGINSGFRVHNGS